MVRIAVIYHSAFGHTEVLAQSVQRGAASVGGVEAVLIRVEDIEVHWTTLSEASAFIFGAPTYMGSVSAGFKLFMDKTGKIWQHREWKDKYAAGFTCSACLFGDKMTTLQQINVFAMQHGMIWVGLDVLPGARSIEGIPLNKVGSFLGVMAYAENDLGPDLAPDNADCATAMYLGERVARTVCRGGGDERGEG